MDTARSVFNFQIFIIKFQFCRLSSVPTYTFEVDLKGDSSVGSPEGDGAGFVIVHQLTAGDDVSRTLSGPVVRLL